MLHTCNRLCIEAELAAILFQIVNVCTVCTILSCQLSCHSPAVAGQHNTVVADYNRCLQCTAIILACNVACQCLGIVVTLIVSVVDALSVLIYWEAFIFHKLCIRVVARCGCTTLNKNVLSCHTFTIWQNNLVPYSFNLVGILPFLLNLRSNIVTSKLRLFLTLLQHFLLSLLLGCNCLLTYLFITLGTLCILCCNNLGLVASNGIPIVGILISLVNLLLPSCTLLAILSNARTHLRLLSFQGFQFLVSSLFVGFNKLVSLFT